jgi:hypothetical protein
MGTNGFNGGIVTFRYEDDSTVQYTLQSNRDVRDHVTTGSWSQSLTGSTGIAATNVWVNNNLRIDRQSFDLTANVNKKLISIDIQDVGASNYNRLAWLGMSVSSCSIKNQVAAAQTLDVSSVMNSDLQGDATPGAYPGTDLIVNGITFLRPASQLLWSADTAAASASGPGTVTFTVDAPPGTVAFHTLMASVWGKLGYYNGAEIVFQFSGGYNHIVQINTEFNIRDHNTQSANTWAQALRDPHSIIAWVNEDTRLDMQTFYMPPESYELELQSVTINDFGPDYQYRTLFVGAAFTGEVLVCSSLANSTEPPVPEYDVQVANGDFVLTLNYSTGYDVYANVTFPDSESTAYCDFTSADKLANSLWQVSSNVLGDGCLSQTVLTVPVADLLANCGFEQNLDIEPSRVHFLQTVSISTAQTRYDLARREQIVTRETQFKVDVSISNNATAFANLQVFGVPVELDGLQNLRIDIETSGSDYLYYVRGAILTDLQWPYRVQEPDASISSNFVASTFSITADTYCDLADGHTEDEVCRQRWTFETQIDPSVACEAHSSLGDWLNVTFQFNCSDAFQGECAPSFSGNGVLAYYLESPFYCPSASSIGLDATLTLYAYDSGNSADAAPANAFYSQAQNAPSSEFVEEAAFVYESNVFGEVHTSVPDAAATLASTKILAITTRPAGFSDIVVYNDLSGQSEGVDGGNVRVENGGFGASETQPTGQVRAYSDARARFQFTWNNNTVQRDESASQTADDAVTVAVDVLVEVTFAQGVSSIDDSPSASRELLSEMSENDRLKSARSIVELMAGQSLFDREFSARSIASLSAGNAASTNPHSDDDDDSIIPGVSNSAAVVGGVAIVTVAAMIAVVATKHNRSSDNKTSSLPPSSSSFDGTIGSAELATSMPISLVNVEEMYATSETGQE